MPAAFPRRFVSAGLLFGWLATLANPSWLLAERPGPTLDGGGAVRAYFDDSLRSLTPLPPNPPAGAAPPRVNGRLVGEFERQAGLVLGCGELMEYAPELFLEFARHTSGRLKIVALVSDKEQAASAAALLRANRLRDDHVLFAEVPHDTMWIRDYGPIAMRHSRGTPLFVDAEYDPSRTLDDESPTTLARLMRVPVVRMPLRIDGGNLLCNGAGLVLTTTRMIEENGLDPLDQASFCDSLRRGFNLRDVVMLEPLEGESTGHVDMFAAFTSPSVVVVARMRIEDDPINSAILERNAERLSEVRLANGKRLRVERIPMPPTGDGIWRTYANVVFANGLLLAPTYSDVPDDTARNEALSTFARLLPGWRVVGVDVSGIIESAGALHCISMNLDASLKSIPRFPAPVRKRSEPRTIPLEELLRAGADEDDSR